MSAEKFKLFLKQHEKSALTFKKWNKTDKIQDLSSQKCVGWQKILSSIATTEALENLLMTEMKKAFHDKPLYLKYLSVHQLDEQNHHKYLNKYLDQTFHYQKTKRTISDKLIYDGVFPKLFKFFAKKPVYGLTLLLFFEVYGVTFYKKFKSKAYQDGLRSLGELIGLIEHDEKRHIAAVKFLLKEQKSEFSPHVWDKYFMKFVLAIAVFDLNMSLWALHNRQVRKHIQEIELNPSDLTLLAKRTKHYVYDQFAMA